MVGVHGTLSWGPGTNPEVGPEESAGPAAVKVQGVEAGSVQWFPGQEGAWCAQEPHPMRQGWGRRPSGTPRPQEAWEGAWASSHRQW